jgi:hypothetical protein
MGFREFENPEQFTLVARELAQTAAKETTRLRADLATIDSVADRLEANAGLGGWNLYHAGIAAFLAGRRDKARAFFSQLSIPDPNDSASGPWLADLRATAVSFAKLSDRQVEMSARLEWIS